MSPEEEAVLSKFKALLQRRFPDVETILFGSRARGDAEEFSDFDVLVIVESSDPEDARRYASDCAWEAGFESGAVIVPVVVQRERWQSGPERFSLLAKAVQEEGIPV